jgi:hypothetical protein
MLSAGLEDPAPPELAEDYKYLAKINGKMSSALPTELPGGLLERVPNLIIV